jgi:hypothetical protein
MAASSRAHPTCTSPTHLYHFDHGPANDEYVHINNLDIHDEYVHYINFHDTPKLPQRDHGQLPR